MPGGMANLMATLKRAVELCMPDLRGYYRVVRKARVTATYASDGRYWCDVQPLRNDESEDSAEPVIPRVEIPILWGGPDRGLVCPPHPGTFCDLEYYDGDPNFPRISNFRWHANQAPACEVGALIIQQLPGVHIKIDAEHNIITITPESRQTELGKDKTTTVGRDKSEDVTRHVHSRSGGDRTEETGGDRTAMVTGSASLEVGGGLDEAVGGAWTIEVAGTAKIKAPQIILEGNLSCTGAGGGVGTSSKRSNETHEGSLILTGPLMVDGDITATGTVHGSNIA